jgi:tetraacyldisaccharide 4'-kinase
MLVPLTLPYALIAEFHCRVQLAGIRRDPLLPLISLGNLEAGGTGKTPAVLALAKLLQESGIRPAVLTGLPGRRGKAVFHSREPGFRNQAADEALLLSRSLPECPLVAARPKWKGVELLDKPEESDLILLDDGFQHRRLARDLNLLLLSGRTPLSFSQVLPAGDLREAPGFALRRADAFVVPEDVPLPENLPERPVFRTGVLSAGLLALDGSSRKPSDSGLIALSGIARPESFEENLAGLGTLKASLRFPDHAPMTPRFREQCLNLLSRFSGSQLVITAKDACRWTDDPLFDVQEPWILDHQIEWREPGVFLSWIRDALGFPVESGGKLD